MQLRVVTTREAVIVENILLRDDEPTAELRALGANAYVGYPLVAHGSLFGTIAFASIEKAWFSEF